MASRSRPGSGAGKRTGGKRSRARTSGGSTRSGDGTRSGAGGARSEGGKRIRSPSPRLPRGATSTGAPPVEIPSDAEHIEVRAGPHAVQLTNLGKVYWPELGITKGDLLRYYVAVSPALLPHLADRAMVMKRYPNGIHGKHFFMKRVPSYKPDWLETCAITHGSGSVIHFPVVQDLAALLWIVNLGCIDLNPWYARCDD